MMATHDIRTIPLDKPLDEYPALPDGWAEVDSDDLQYEARAAWVHEQTAIQVCVEYQRRPSQMHTPEASSDDTGYITEVRGETVEQLTPNLAAKEHAYKRAYELMLNFPEGNFEPVRRDIALEGPRDIEAWFE